MPFCHACGQHLVTDGRYCQHCGTRQEPVYPVSTEPPPPVSVTQPIPVAAAQSSGVSQTHPVATTEAIPAPAVSPSATTTEGSTAVGGTAVGGPGPDVSVPGSGPGMPTARAVRTGLAAVLLVLSLLTRWDAVGNGGDLSWTLLALLAALVACAVPYLLRPAVLDRHVPPGQLDAVIALLIAPVVLVAVVTMVRGLAQDRGVGTGVAFAVAAAVLLAQSREGDAPPARIPAVWRTVAAALYLAAGLWGLTGVAVLVGSSGAGDYSFAATSVVAAWALVAPLLGLSGAVGWVGVQLFRRDASAWAGGLALAACLVVAFVALSEAGGVGAGAGPGSWSIDAALGGMAVLSVAGATASCAGGVRGQLTPPMSLGVGWVQAALGVLTVAAIGGVGLVLQAALTVATVRSLGAPDRLTPIWFLALSAVAVAALLAARVVLGRRPGRGRAATIGLTTGVVLLAIVGYAVTEASVGFLGLVVYFLGPLTVMAMVSLPPSVRAHYGPLIPGQNDTLSGAPTGAPSDPEATGAGSSVWSPPPPQ